VKTNKDNIFNNIPDIITQELFESLEDHNNLKIERIISQGHCTPAGQWYDQDWNEWVLLVQGEATISYQDGLTVSLQAGDYLMIPAHTRHRVAWTQPDQTTIWLAIHFAT
jgi:cupin 2 domain-containing protein